MKKYWVYILSCTQDRYYTGYTNDLERRYQQHVDGTARCKFTRSFKPLAIAQSWLMTEKKQAMQLERCIKQLNKQQKQFIILHPECLMDIVLLRDPKPTS